MFKRKKRGWISEMGDSRVTVYDFRRRLTDYESYRPSAYRLNPALEEDVMYPKLEDHLKRLFAGDIDAGNGDILDKLIFAEVREGMTDLKIQRYDHTDTNARLASRYHTDYHDVQLIRQQRQNELEVLEKDHEETQAMVARSMRKEHGHAKEI